jgi:hypothetical protein
MAQLPVSALLGGNLVASMLILPPLEINAGFSVRIDDPSSFIGKIKKKQKTSPIMGEVFLTNKQAICAINQ